MKVNRRLLASSALVFGIGLAMQGLFVAQAQAELCRGLEATHVGSNSNDTWSGGGGMDIIASLDGDDNMQGQGDDDLICGDQGSDTRNNGLAGGDGVDTIYGNDGSDVLNGVNGRDWLFGNDGGDSLWGGDNPDPDPDESFFGESGDDFLYGEEGQDALEGGGDDDVLFGGDGVDEFWGGGGEDWCYGGAAIDVLHDCDHWSQT